ncbi:MAG TPA: FkbM family methyltransferase [Flavobacteriales bacterium]|nr:FkbM family methyltransferase [Flavobacteriales bacterium]HRE97949.1 FkbM family methyltransferase [Flavobacteriales bacterium]HRJ37787.1 FkbM family methyltransferase [Flavobacteriales bacterium]
MKRRLKSMVKGILKFIPIRFSRNQRYDAQTLEIMRRVLKPGSVCVDVGAHEGEILREMIKYAPGGKYFCFEPIPNLYEKVKRTFPEAKVFDCALSDHKGSASFQYVVSNPAYSGLKRREYKGKEEIKEIEVKTELLDDLLPLSEQIHLIKIDVEGGELGVLRGAEKLIRKWKPVVIFEHGKGASEFYGTGPDHVFSFFQEAGMKISILNSYLNNAEALSAEEFKRQFEQGINYYFIAHP